MRPRIAWTTFGSITIDGRTYEHDVAIRLDGKVKKRKKKLSKANHGTSHRISLDEAKYVYQKGAQRLILGSGQNGLVELSEQAAAYLRRKGCTADLMPTKQAIKAWNKAEGAVVGLFHVTC